MTIGAPRSFGAQLKALREAAGFTQEELATIAGLSVHAISALERGERRRPHPETVRALSAALDLTGAARDALVASARAPAHVTAADELSGAALPVALTPLLGRDADVPILQKWLAEPAVRLVTLTGPGGVGKTRVALEVARTIAAEGVTRVVFVPLAAIREPPLVASAIAEAVGLADVAMRDLPKRLHIACGDRPTLLVLDNFEHVLDASPLVADLLLSVTPLRVLVTSRAALHVRGEREYVIAPLPLTFDAGTMLPADLVHAPAARLFVERVREVQPEFRLTASNTPVVAAICRRLDGLPLALELAAPWIKVLTPDDLLRRLEHGSMQPTVVARDLPERQQTMNGTIAWSYQLLDADDQRAFRRFGVLPGLFPIDAAVSVLAGRHATTDDGEALRAAASLIDKSLLVRSENSVVATCPLYRMLETVRAYAGAELAASGEREDAYEGLVRYCIGEASLAASGLIGPAQAEWLDRVREDLESHRGALGWLIERGRPSEAIDIAWALLFFWLIRGHAAEGLRWYEQIVHVTSRTPEAESRALAGAGIMLYAQGDLQRARAELERARTCANGCGEMDVVALAELMRGYVELGDGNIEAARNWVTQGNERFRSFPIPWGTGQALNGLAWVAVATGDLDQAEHLLDNAVSALRDVGPWFLGLPRYLRALVAIRRGRPDDAIALIRDTFTDLRELHDRFAFVYSLVPLAAAAALKGDHDTVARVIGARDAITESTGAMVADHSTRDLQEHAEREARARLGTERWAAAYAAGRRSSIDALLKDIESVAGKRAVQRESAE